MSKIVLNEIEWVDNLLSGNANTAGIMETLIRLAKYYTYCGQKKSAVKKSLEDYLRKRGETPETVRLQQMIDSSIRISSKSKIFVSDGVDITQGELDAIEAVDGWQARRLAFTLLCLAKYLNQKRAKNDWWVSTPDKDIIRLANISATIKRQSAIFAKLQEAGLIRFSKKVDDLSVQVLFASDGEPVIHISDFRNIGNQYMRIYHNGYYVCENCGLVLKDPHRAGQNCRPRKYCDDCAMKIKVKQNVESVMRHRANSA